MRIAGRLSNTTLGDVLGSLARTRATGLVRLTEGCGPSAGRTHGVYLQMGRVVSVETQATSPLLGEILRERGLLDGAALRRLCLRRTSGETKTGEYLVAEGLISRDALGAALRQQVRARLEALFRLQEATLTFHVACPSVPAIAPGLDACEFLRGRPRARDRAGVEATAGDGARPSGPSGYRGGASAPRFSPGGRAPTARQRALCVLGLGDDATPAEVTQAFRERARWLHPDRFVQDGEAARRAAEQRFATLSAAYHVLVG